MARLRLSMALGMAVLATRLPAQTAAAPAVATQTKPGAAVPTLHAHSDLVVVDVVVTDANHSAVHGLKLKDFTLLESNTAQQIKSFEEHSALSPAEAAKLEPMPKLPPGEFTNFSVAPANGTVNVLLLDALNTPMKDQSYVRAQLLAYLKSAPQGTRIAIFGLTTHLLLLQGFTSDPAVLKAVVTGKTGPKSSVLLDDPVSGGITPTLSDTLSDQLGNDPSAAQMIANMQQFEAQQASFQLMLRAQYTLDAMNQLARYLTSIPGRKNLIWFSGSFPLNVMPDGDLADPFAAVASAEDEYRQTTNLLARSQVAVYPIDARGLMNSPVFDASNSGAGYARNPRAFAKAQDKFSTDTAGEHATMYAMADDTGGQAFVNTNGLTQAVAKAIESGSNYYTISYSPSDPKWNGQYRKIQVKLAQAGLALTYRHGYYADDPDGPPKRNGESAATAPTRSNPMSVAMMRGAPDPTEIIFKARILPASTTTEDTVAQGNTINLDPKLKVKGPYRRYVITMAADPSGILFTATPDGIYHCSIEFATFVYDHDGALINSFQTRIRTNLSPASYTAIHHGGIQFSQEISVPVKGEYFLRSGIHDMETDHVGAIELPVEAVARLAPEVAAEAAPSTAAK